MKKAVFPESLLENGNAFIVQYRLFVTFLRWVWLFSVFFILFLNKAIIPCGSLDLASMKSCHRSSILMGHTSLLLCGYIGLIALYIFCVKMTSTKTEKKEHQKDD